MKNQPPFGMLSMDAIKAIGQVIDGEWHTIKRPGAKKESVIWHLSWERILEYRYIRSDEGKTMRVRLHKRVRRYFTPNLKPK
jgi:hypothetical protein